MAYLCSIKERYSINIQKTNKMANSVTAKPTITTENFFLATRANFTPASAEIVEYTQNNNPDFESNSGSKYWYIGDLVVRASDHWGFARSCCWLLDGKGFDGSRISHIGSCRLGDFNPKKDEPIEGGLYEISTSSIYGIDTVTAKSFYSKKEKAFVFKYKSDGRWYTQRPIHTFFSKKIN